MHFDSWNSVEFMFLFSDFVYFISFLSDLSIHSNDNNDDNNDNNNGVKIMFLTTNCEKFWKVVLRLITVSLLQMQYL